MTPPLTKQLRALGACADAVEWVGDRTLAQAWSECHRADWMFWFLERSKGWSRDALNECLIDIMALALEAARPTCERESYWAQVEAAHAQTRDAIRNKGDLSAAALAADAAAGAAWAAADAAADAAALAAAWAAAWAAADAAAWAAADAAAWAAAWAAARAEIANIVRQHFPQPPQLAATVTE